MSLPTFYVRWGDVLRMLAWRFPGILFYGRCLEDENGALCGCPVLVPVNRAGRGTCPYGFNIENPSKNSEKNQSQKANSDTSGAALTYLPKKKTGTGGPVQGGFWTTHKTPKISKELSG
jgi:hypothetical protein